MKFDALSREVKVIREPIKSVRSYEEEPVLKIGGSRRAAAKVAGWKESDATRYLCAEAHRSAKFREWVLKKFAREKHLALAPSYGLDTATVLRHCLEARRRVNVRNAFLTIPFFVLLLVLLVGLGNLELLPIAIILGPLAAWAGAWLIVAWERYEAEKLVRHNLLKGSYNPDCVPPAKHLEMQQVMKDLDEAQSANVVIYNGFAPFVGNGGSLGGWSFAVDVNKGKEDLGQMVAPLSFEVKELYDEIAQTAKSLGFDGLKIENLLCVNGQDIRSDTRFLPDPLGRPCTRVTPEVVSEFVESDDLVVRHYQRIQVVDWSGELALNVMLRFVNTGHHLFIEVNYNVLTPVYERYHGVDSLNPELSFEDWMQLGVTSFFLTPFFLAALPFLPLVFVSRKYDEWREERKLRKTVRNNRSFNYGAVTSLREDTASGFYRRYFQKLDSELYKKVLERQIFDTIIKFLDARNIETTDLKERQTTVLNSGVIVSGSGTIQAETFAVGSHSTAKSEKSERPSRLSFVKNLGTRSVGAGH
ncbi:MAG TPA: hypothetical protein VMP68_14785 [Candidatus Eisenbacteria bacterium]|nr:hypothetical protein [Candidatus Eisenbacteria bacterium]